MPRLPKENYENQDPFYLLPAIIGFEVTLQKFFDK